MSNFWNTSTGKIASGSEQDANVAKIDVIPDGTSAPAVIKKFEIIIPEGNQLPEYYQVTFKLCDGEFKNFEVRMKMEVNNENKKKSDRAKNVLMRLYLLCGIQAPDHAPTVNDIMAFKGLVVGIVIAEWHQVNANGEAINGNWVRELHKADSEFKIESGVKSQPVTKNASSHLESALTRNSNSRLTQPFIDDDLASIGL